MQTLETIRQLYDYNIWANHEFPLYFQRIPQPDEKAVRVFAHLPLAEKTWLERSRGKIPTTREKIFGRAKLLRTAPRFSRKTNRNSQSFSAF